jgi:AcrR family transcriptional regulator
MPRAGLTPHAVARAAASLVDREGRAALTLARVADDLGVKSPSLYNHIESLGALERLVSLDGIDRLADTCRAAAMGRSGADGFRAMAHAYRGFAVAHPGVYPLTQVSRPGDAEYEAKAARLLEPVLAILTGFGLPQAELVHAARAVRSALHGFAVLENDAGFGLDVDVDQSFEWMLDSIERALSVTDGRAATGTRAAVG